jgi:hypothetical protein
LLTSTTSPCSDHNDARHHEGACLSCLSEALFQQVQQSLLRINEA